jgi:hypothetical protein
MYFSENILHCTNAKINLTGNVAHVLFPSLDNWQLLCLSVL